MALMISSCSSEVNSTNEYYGHVAFYISVIPDTVDLAGRSISLSMMSADGNYSHTWADYRDFSLLDGFYAGSYRAKAVLGTEGAEGYGCECFIGTSDFEVADNSLTTVRMECTLSQAKVMAVASDALLERFPDACVMVHSSGASYVDVLFDRDNPAFITPGTTGVLVRLVDSDGDDVTIDTGLEFLTEANGDYAITAELNDDLLSVGVGFRKVDVPVGDDVLLSDSPEVNCFGFADNIPVNLIEGLPAESNIRMDVQSSVPLRKVVLTAVGVGNVSPSLPEECNLLADAGKYPEMGLVVDKESDRSLTVDFTRMLENLRVKSGSDISFMLQAVDALGRASDVANLRVSISGVEMEVVDATKAMLGENIATVSLRFNVSRVEESDFSVFLDDRTTPDVESLEVISASQTDDRHMDITFKVPEGISSLPVRIDYMDTPKLALEIERGLPEFNFSVDPFATTVVASVRASSDAVTAAIAKYARIVADGKEMAVLSRNTEDGYLYCAGFSPDSNYDVECVVLKNASSKTCRIHTEKAIPVPDGNFEDVSELIKYPSFPSGGTYSSTSFPIFNQQNYVDYHVMWPRKNWASINEKTFCRSADLHNTWYMQPSSVIDFDFFAAGSKSVRMSSVGWSMNGSEIPPYVQPVDAFESYNANYPPIDNISAGYLFLGDYSFNPADRTEVISEGVKFNSRPSSLNGFFKYTPDEGSPSDRGWVRVELVNEGPAGELTVIGSGYMEFPYAPDFRSFNIPITYTNYYIPATRLKILFCSSVYSEGISFDDPEVPVSADIPNSRYIGSTLWIDNLSFSY